MSEKEESFDPKGKPNYLRIIIFLGISGVLALIMLEKIRPHSATDLEKTATSEVEYLKLQDGSEVWMRKGAVLVYPDEFDPKERSIRLRGEARVKGVFTEDVPFSLQVHRYTLTSAGFEAHAIYPEDSSFVEIRLLKGPALLTAQHIESMMVAGGDLLRIDKESGEVSISALPDPNALSWQENRLKFEDSPLPSVLRDISRHFGIRIETDLPASDSCRFSGDFKSPKLDKVMDRLESQLGLQSETAGQGAYLLKLGDCGS